MMNIRKYSVLVALMMIVTCGQSAASRFEENEKPGDKSLPSDNLATAKTLVARNSMDYVWAETAARWLLSLEKTAAM